MHIPSPSISGFHFYALMYLVGIALAILITRRRWQAKGGDPELVGDVAIWAVPAGIIGGRIYFDITTPMDIPHVWYGVFAIWSGGLGIWGGIALAAVVGAWRVRRTGASVAVFMDAIAPALLVAQAVGRIGNYFNKELFGKPTGLPWGLEIPLAYRPPGYTAFSTFQPSFLYELIFDLLLAAALVWVGHHLRTKPPGLFALYVAGYSAYRIFEETIRIDSSAHFLGLRLNMFVAIAMTLIGSGWFAWTQIKGRHTADERADSQIASGSAADGSAADGSAADGSAAASTAGDSTGGETEIRDDPAEATAEGVTPRASD